MPKKEQPKLKYRIKEILATYPANSQREIRKKIRANCGHSESNRATLSEWENIAFDSHQSISGDNLRIIAKLLHYTVEELHSSEAVTK